MVGDHSELDLIRVISDLDGLLQVVDVSLDTVEALNVVIGEAVFVELRVSGVLDEANHSLITVGGELTVVTSLKIREDRRVLSEWSGRDCWVYSVLEVGHESQSVVELDGEGLIVDHRPGSLNGLGTTFHGILAEGGHSPVSIQ